MKRKNPFDEYLSTEKAGELVGFTQSHIRRLIAEKKIKAFKVGDSWKIHVNDLKRIRRKRAKKRPKTALINPIEY